MRVRGVCFQGAVPGGAWGAIRGIGWGC
ncbi:MAG: hypothetical protein K0S81_2294, partial [Rhodospirillales bacterium]|nr:hypothetical protein [Geminicoccaceae bacterium]MCD6071229.1 hypothetical protein [Microvirga sp.]MDF2765300.1 hypothetical protein [Rhodospirillales bacterium]